jgi:hypothetical protein
MNINQNKSYANVVPKEHELLCILDGVKFKNAHDRNWHIKRVHGLTYEQYIMQNYFNNEYPICKCGKCNTKMKFVDSPFGIWFRDYTKNHFPRKPHTEESKQKMKKTCVETMLREYGVTNSMYIPGVVDKIKVTKEKNHNDPNYNNIEKHRQTIKDRYNIDNVYVFHKKRKGSIPEDKIFDIIGGEHHFIFENKDFDIRIGNDVFEIEGKFHHPLKFKNLKLTQINSLLNDYTKLQLIKNSQYTLYKISLYNLPKIINVDTLKENSHIPNYILNYNDIIMNKKYINRYIQKHNLGKMFKYVNMILKFIRIFQPTFPDKDIIDDVIISYWFNDNEMLKIIKYIIELNKEEAKMDLSLKEIVYQLIK